MPHVMNLACINYKMKPNEALTASTLNAACIFIFYILYLKIKN